MLLHLLFLFAVNKISGEGICDKTKITVLANGTKQCLPCVACRRGWGSTYSCGDVLKAPLPTPIKCVRCKKRYTFSAGRSSEACQKCTPCQRNQQIKKKCTRSADRVCGGCKKGYYKYRDPHLSTCEKCSPCCGDGKDKWIKECANQGLPKNLQCSFRQDRKCSLSSSSEMSSQSVPLIKSYITDQKIMASTFTTQPAAENDNPIINIKAVNNNSMPGSASNNLLAMVVVPVFLLLLITAVVGGIWKHIKNGKTLPQQRNSTFFESSNYREQEGHEPGEADSFLNAAPSRPLKEFIEDPTEWSVYNTFCTQLNAKVDPHMEEHFYSISRAFGIDFDTAKMVMEEKRGAVQALFDYLVSTKSEPVTMEQVARILDNLPGRYEAAKILREADDRLKQKAFEA